MDTHFAVVDGWTIILDVVRNRYVSLTPDATKIWLHVMSDGTSPTLQDLAADRQESLAETEDYVAQQVLEWRDEGLLTPRAAEKPTPRHPVVGTSALDRSIVQAAPLRPAAVGRICLAAVRRRWRSRTATLADMLMYFQATSGSSQARCDEQAQKKQLIEMVRAYNTTRSVISAGNQDCLERSLDLCLALRSLGIDARLCFGVRMFPFSAHAWAQVGAVIVNDRETKVNSYTHIAQF